MTRYLFEPPETKDELSWRRAYVSQRFASGHPVSLSSVVWAEAGKTFRPPNGWKVYAMIATARGYPEIQGPFKNAQEAADYVVLCDFDSMLFALDPETVGEWDNTSDKYVLVRVVAAPT